MAQALGRAQEGLLLRLPHDILVALFVRLELRDLGHLAATCRLLQYGKSSPQTPNPVEDALRLRTELSGWSGTLSVDPRLAIKCLLRLAWQDDLEFQSITADRLFPISYFIDPSGALRVCGVEVQFNPETEKFIHASDAAAAGHMGFGSDWCVDSGSDYLRKDVPTLVPAIEGVRMRSAASGGFHVLVLTDEGRVYRWGAASETSQAPDVPTLYEEINELRMRRVAAGTFHSAALTNEGKLYTWWENKVVSQGKDGAGGAGYPPPDPGDVEGASCRPSCVEALAGIRIASVAAGQNCTIAATDQGVQHQGPQRLHSDLRLAATH
jgi:hypothetical protein